MGGGGAEFFIGGSQISMGISETLPTDGGRVSQQFKCRLYFHSRAMALFHYYDTATVRHQHQLLTSKTSK